MPLRICRPAEPVVDDRRTVPFPSLWPREQRAAAHRVESDAIQTCGVVVASGLYFPSSGADVAEWVAAGVFPRLPGWLVVLAHRDPVTDVVMMRAGSVSFGQFARRVAAENHAGLPVLLMVCGGGMPGAEGALAEAVRAATRTPVLATPGVVWQMPWGVRTAAAPVDRRGRPVLRVPRNGERPGGPGWWYYSADGGAARWMGADLGVALHMLTPEIAVARLSALPLGKPMAWVAKRTVARYWITENQFATLNHNGLRIDPRVLPDINPQAPPYVDGFLAAVIEQVPQQVRVWAGLNSPTPLAKPRLTAAGLRKFMAKEFSYWYGANRDRYDAVMLDARRQPITETGVTELLGNPSRADAGLLSAVLPLLAADMFKAWVNIVAADGAMVSVGPADGPAQRPASAPEITVLSLSYFVGHFLPLTRGTQPEPKKFAPKLNPNRLSTDQVNPITPVERRIRPSLPSIAPATSVPHGDKRSAAVLPALPQPKGDRGPGQIVWLSSPRDGLRQAQANEEVPTASNWTMVVGHGADGRVRDGDGWLDGKGLAERLEHVRQGRVLLVCDAAGSARKCRWRSAHTHTRTCPSRYSPRPVRRSSTSPAT